jgi:hypothetical protein
MTDALLAHVNKFSVLVDIIVSILSDDLRVCVVQPDNVQSKGKGKCKIVPVLN